MIFFQSLGQPLNNSKIDDNKSHIAEPKRNNNKRSKRKKNKNKNNQHELFKTRKVNEINVQVSFSDSTMKTFDDEANNDAGNDTEQNKIKNLKKIGT